MTNLAVFNFKSNQVRVMVVNNEPWFLAIDICAAIELGNVSDACSRLKDYEKLISPLVMKGQSRDVVWVSESGLYRLILTSRKPQAETFQDWMFQNVLPAIRKSSDIADFLRNNRQASNKSGFVYLATTPNKWCKIGMSKQPYKRMSSLQTGTPLEITLVHRIFTFDMPLLESKLHKYYQAYWLRGEWFDLSESMIAEFPLIANQIDAEIEQVCLPSEV